MSMATSLLLVKAYTADAAFILIVEPPHSETAATPWDQHSSFTSPTK
jgi:hypothetical protein